MDIIQVLTQQPDYQKARKYWNKLKERLGKEGSQSVTNCHQLKLSAADGKSYLIAVATAETMLLLHVPWTAHVSSGNSMAEARNGSSSG